MRAYQLRFREATRQLTLWMTPQREAELAAVHEDDEVGGWGLRDAHAYPGVADLVWGDVYFGIVSTTWLETGERPVPWPPAGFSDYPHAPE